MNHFMNPKRRFYTVLMLITLLLIHAPFTALALEEGAYVVSNTTYYVNPDTGSGDGGDTSIGESMCRNCVYESSLYEYKGGEYFVVIRLKLISQIKDVKFELQGTKGDGESYTSVSYTAAGENKEANTKDFRIKVPSDNVMIKPSFYVIPMQRDVTFYVGLKLDGSNKDDGSFTGGNDRTEKAAGISDDAVGGSTENSVSSSQGEESGTKKSEKNVNLQGDKDTMETGTDVNSSGEPQEGAEEKIGSLTGGSVKTEDLIADSDAEKSVMNDENVGSDQGHSGSSSTAVISGIVLLAAVIGAGIYFLRKKYRA